MRRLAIGLGISTLVLAAACSEYTTTPVDASSKGTKAGSDSTSGGKKGAESDDSADDELNDDTVDTGDDTKSEKPDDKDKEPSTTKPETPVVTPEKPADPVVVVPTCEKSPGKAVKFAEKVKDMIAGDLGADGTLGDKPRTLELWAKFTSANSWTAEQSIIELGKPGNPDPGNNVFGIDMSGRNGDSGVFGPYTHGVSDNNGGNAPPKFAATPNVGWLHLSWSYDPSKNPANTRFQFTVNGNVLPTEFQQGKYDATSGKLIGNTGFVLLGASQNFGNDGWDGVMDEVRIWTVARTAQQIKDNMNVIVKPTTPGLFAYYQFNEADAANIKDSTGNAAHKLSACSAAGGACPSKNTAEPKFVDSDIPGAFSCGQ